MSLSLRNEVMGMPRVYIENNAKITLREGDFRLDVQLDVGTSFENVEARCLFPTNAPNQYVTLLDTDGQEIAIIRDINALSAESAQAVSQAIKERYLVPRITKVIHFRGKPGGFYITAETDRGICQFKLNNRHHDIKRMFDYRVLIRDSNDNRYEIPDYRTLDRKSLNNLLL